jgi:hypothetical protein
MPLTGRTDRRSVRGFPGAAASGRIAAGHPVEEQLS